MSIEDGESFKGPTESPAERAQRLIKDSGLIEETDALEHGPEEVLPNDEEQLPPDDGELPLW